MARYPVLYAGQRWTATLASQLQDDVYRKTGTTTRASNTGVAADPDLAVTVEAGGIYLIYMRFKYASTTAAGFHTQWVVPTGATGNRNTLGLGDGAADNTPSGTAFSMHQGVHGFTTTVNYGTRNSVSLQVWAEEWAEVTVGANAGTVALGWGQVVSTAVNTVVAAGSIATGMRIG